MSKFTVMYKSTNSMYLNVEADSLEEAKETAENTDGGEFINAGSGDWEYDYTEDENGNVIDTGNNDFLREQLKELQADLFDVDKYFGTTTKKDNTWISFDVCWTPNGSVHAEYRLRSFDDCCKCLVDWRLTEEEQEIILDKMEEYCMQEAGKTLQELWDSYEAE